MGGYSSTAGYAQQEGKIKIIQDENRPKILARDRTELHGLGFYSGLGVSAKIHVDPWRIEFYLTVNRTVVECCSEPLVAVTVMV
jgi:hypothetical protein